MKIEVHSDKPIAETTRDEVASAVEGGLAHFNERITRVEVFLKNVGHDAKAIPVECKLEARPASHDPVFAHEEAASLEGAVEGATEKMERLLVSLFGRLDSTRGGSSASGQPT